MGSSVSCSNAPSSRDQQSVTPLDHMQVQNAIVHHQKVEKDYLYLESLTHFDVDTLRKLHQRFCEIDHDGNSDSMIDIQELVTALGLDQTSLLGQRIFAYFDKHNLGSLNFRNFVMALNGLSKESPLEEKIKLSFYLYDINQDGSIDSNEIRSLVDAALEGTEEDWTEDQKVEICKSTFEQVDSNNDGLVQYAEYKEYCEGHPQLLRAFTIDVRDIVKGEPEVKRHSKSDRRINRGPLALSADGTVPKSTLGSVKKLFRRSRVSNLKKVDMKEKNSILAD